MNKKIILLLTTSALSTHSFADAKSDALSQMSAGTNGGLVNNSVNYNTPSPQSTAQNVVSTQNQSGFLMNGISPQSNANNVVKPKKKSKRTVTKKTVQHSDVNKIGSQNFDISFSGSVSDLLNKLKEYDPQLRILPPLGKVSTTTVTFDLQDVQLTDVIASVSSQTNSVVKIIYDSNANTIRASYTTLISFADDAVKQSLAWRADAGNKPRPIMTPDGIVLFPYGQYAATITCKTQQICDLRFDKGEHIIDAVMGDTQKWAVMGAVSGSANTQIQHIVLKPYYADLNTNMMVTTDKGRVYNITLKSNDTKYITSAGWYYPQDIQNDIDSKFAQLKSIALGNNVDVGSGGASSNRNLDPSVNAGVGTSINKTYVNTSGYDDDGLPQLDMDFRYKTSGDDVIWKPTQIFNDGIRTFIKVDPKSLFQPSPTFVVVDPNTNQLELVNFRQKGNWYIVDQVFEKGAFIYNVGRNQQRVDITHITNTKKPNTNQLY